VNIFTKKHYRKSFLVPTQGRKEIILIFSSFLHNQLLIGCFDHILLILESLTWFLFHLWLAFHNWKAVDVRKYFNFLILKVHFYLSLLAHTDFSEVLRLIISDNHDWKRNSFTFYSSFAVVCFLARFIILWLLMSRSFDFFHLLLLNPPLQRLFFVSKLLQKLIFLTDSFFYGVYLSFELFFLSNY
jgi:hypothetical protein